MGGGGGGGGGGRVISRKDASSAGGGSSGGRLGGLPPRPGTKRPANAALPAPKKLRRTKTSSKAAGSSDVFSNRSDHSVVKTVNKLRRTYRNNQNKDEQELMQQNEAALREVTENLERIARSRAAGAAASEQVPKQESGLCLPSTGYCNKGRACKNNCSAQRTTKRVVLKLQNDKDPSEDFAMHPTLLPKQLSIPNFASWIYSKCNVLERPKPAAVRRVYYDSLKDETIMCSDSEDELDMDVAQNPGWHDLRDFVLTGCIEAHGTGEGVFAAIADRFSCSIASLKDRYAALCADKESKEQKSHVHQHLSLADALEPMQELYCRRCHMFNCSVHGVDRPSPCKSRKHSTALPPQSSEPCSSDCFMSHSMAVSSPLTEELKGGPCETSTVASAPGAASSSSDWQPFELDILQKGLAIYSYNNCQVARLLNGLRTCAAVAQRLQQHKDMADNLLSAVRPSSGSSDRSSRKDQTVEQSSAAAAEPKAEVIKKGGKSGRMKMSLTVRKRLEHPPDQAWKAYYPCSHPGKRCDQHCSCVKSGNFCEKYCACSDNCANRFQGCNCNRSSCRTRTCPCVAAARECDPDLCHRCNKTCDVIAAGGTLPGAEVAGDINNAADAVVGGGAAAAVGESRSNGGKDSSEDEQQPHEHICGNMQLRLRLHKHVLFGISDIEGWGVFSRDEIKKNECIGEYTGELVSQAEADRRGKLYDKVNSSFLFNLNDQQVLDACPKGDKLKFANHSTSPNCFARVLLVSGDYRVGIFAKSAIAPGEELFYDYRYEKERAPSWARVEGGKADESKAEKGGAK
eukprot:jgi/Chlat1/7256/Chrsp58S06896